MFYQRYDVIKSFFNQLCSGVLVSKIPPKQSVLIPQSFRYDGIRKKVLQNHLLLNLCFHFQHHKKSCCFFYKTSFNLSYNHVLSSHCPYICHLCSICICIYVSSKVQASLFATESIELLEFLFCGNKNHWSKRASINEFLKLNKN